MGARVTDNIVRGETIVILKHTPCIVIGWELHLLYRIQGEGAEIFLTKMPPCIYIKFENVSWIVDKKLGVGVYPLHPFQRTWTLKTSTGAKIRRHGFSLLPDYAWTAFMSQGMNLEAGLADCGDVLGFPGLSEQMNKYVVLSRFTRADGLLLMRAFSHELFRTGVPPGPHCLFKFLMNRFATGASRKQYPADDARTEYDERVAAYDALRERIQSIGPRWTCSECSHEFSAAGSGTTHTDADGVYGKCVAPGYWRRCLACARGRAKPPSLAAEIERRLCASCNEEREECFLSHQKRTRVRLAYWQTRQILCRALNAGSFLPERTCEGIRVQRKVNFAGGPRRSCLNSRARCAR